MTADERELYDIFLAISERRWLAARLLLERCPPDRYLWFRDLVRYALAVNAPVAGEV